MTTLKFCSQDSSLFFRRRFFVVLEASDTFLEGWSFLSGEWVAFRLYRLTEEKRLAVLDGLEWDESNLFQTVNAL